MKISILSLLLVISVLLWFACGEIKHMGGISTNSVASEIICPNNYVIVPGNSNFETSDFCVAKYEMKCSDDATGLSCSGVGNGSMAESKAESKPWVNISQNALGTIGAISACNALDDSFCDYHLITNDEWQTIAINIENVAENWTAAGVLKQGLIGIACSSGDNDACYIEAAAVDRSVDLNEKAKLKLSNGQEIWDFSGNVHEFVDFDGAGGLLSYTNATSTWEQFDSTNAINIYNSTADFSEEDFMPSRSYTPSSYTSKGFGKIYFNSTGSNYVVRRGGGFLYAGIGIFTATLNGGHTNYYNYVGFRCSCNPL